MMSESTIGVGPSMSIVQSFEYGWTSLIYDCFIVGRDVVNGKVIIKLTIGHGLIDDYIYTINSELDWLYVPMDEIDMPKKEYNMYLRLGLLDTMDYFVGANVKAQLNCESSLWK